MTLWRLGCILIVVATALAGCGTPSHPAESTTTSQTVPPSASPSSPPINCADAIAKGCPPAPWGPPRRFEMNQCQLIPAIVFIDVSKMKAALPAGYSPNPLAGSATEMGHLNLYQCDSIVVDNQTVVKNFQMAEFSAQVVAPNDAQSPDRNRADVYVFEVIVNNQTVADAFARAGFRAQSGHLEIQLANQVLQFKVYLGDKDVYDYQGSGETMPRSTSTPSISRWHQENDNRHRWANFTVDEFLTFTGVGTFGVMTLQGGAIANLAYNAGATPVEATIGNGKVFLDFP